MKNKGIVLFAALILVLASCGKKEVQTVCTNNFQRNVTITSVDNEVQMVKFEDEYSSDKYDIETIKALEATLSSQEFEAKGVTREIKSTDKSLKVNTTVDYDKIDKKGLEKAATFMGLPLATEKDYKNFEKFTEELKKTGVKCKTEK